MTIEDIALQMTPGIGVKGAVHLLGVFGSARDIFAAAPDELAGGARAPRAKRACGKREPGKSSAAEDSPPRKRSWSIVAATESRPSPRPIRNTRRSCGKSPTIPMSYT